MKCVEVNELIQRNLDSDLSEAEHERLNDHLDLCSDCKSFYERLRHVHLDLENLPKVTLPYSIVDSILPALDRINPIQTEIINERVELKKKKWKPNHRWLSAFTAVAAGVVIVLSVSQFIQPNNYQEAQNEHTDSALESGFATRASQPSLTMSSMPSIDTMQADPNHTDDTNDKSADMDSQLSREMAISQPVGIANSDSPAMEQDKSESSLAAPVVTSADPREESQIDSTEATTTKHPVVSSNKEPANSLMLKDREKISVTDNPSFTTSHSKDRMNTIESPDHTYIASYNEKLILIGTSDNRVSMQIEALEEETFSDILWVDSTHLQYTVQLSTASQIWIFDVSSGAKIHKN